MNNPLSIRKECEHDYDAIRHVVRDAFAKAEHTDGDEHNLVERLRQTDEYIPELSLVAEVNDEIVGYVMFSRILIDNVIAVAPAPLAVLPSCQRQGIGEALIRSGHQKAIELGYICSVVLGSPEYYTKHGYIQASSFGIMPPFDVPSQYYMVCPLNPPVPHGKVTYSKAFML